MASTPSSPLTGLLLHLLELGPAPGGGAAAGPQPILDDIASAVTNHLNSSKARRRKQRDVRRPVPLSLALTAAQMLLEHHKYFAFLPARVACNTIGLDSPWRGARVRPGFELFGGRRPSPWCVCV